MKLLGLALACTLVLSATPASLAADELSPRVQLMAAAPRGPADRAVLAHELAHQDLNHVAKAEVLGLQTSGPDSGGFFATHPGTDDRIAAVRKMP
jgi:hypothetical protein